MILYELAKRYEERAKLQESLSQADEAAGQIPKLRDEMALLERKLYEQARRWLHDVNLAALLPSAIPPDTMAMLPDIPSMTASSEIPESRI